MSIDVELRVSSTGSPLDERLSRMLAIEPALHDAGAHLEAGVEAAFAAQGPGWAPLADWTREERYIQGYSPDHPILIRSGSYLDSFIADLLPGGDGVGVGSDDPRFEVLNNGGTTEDGRAVPARPVVIGPSYVAAALGELRAHLKDA